MSHKNYSRLKSYEINLVKKKKKKDQQRKRGIIPGRKSNLDQIEPRNVQIQNNNASMYSANTLFAYI